MVWFDPAPVPMAQVFDPPVQVVVEVVVVQALARAASV
jgi:hypothetical protein